MTVNTASAIIIGGYKLTYQQNLISNLGKTSKFFLKKPKQSLRYWYKEACQQHILAINNLFTNLW